MSVLYGTGSLRPEVQEILESLPQLKVVGQTADPENFCNQSQPQSPDMVLVDLDGKVSLPQWLEDLTQSFSQTSVWVCSHNREPDFLIRAMQMGVREFLPLPLRKSDLEAAMERTLVAKKRLRSVSSRPGRLVVVTGHKGGAGATSIAVNLAMVLAELTSEPLALVDLGRPFPDVANFLDQQPNHTIFDLVQNSSNLDYSFLQRIMQPYEDKISVLHGCSDFKEQDSIELEALDKIFTLLRGAYKWIIVDLSHWLDAFFMQVVKEADLVLLLTELTIPDLKNLKKLWTLFREGYHDRDKIKVIINRYQKANGLQLGDLEQVVQGPAFDILPLDYLALSEAITKGVPLSLVAPRSKLQRSLQRLAQRLKDETREALEEATASAAPRRKFWIFSKG